MPRRRRLPGDMWCSFGKHRSYVLPELRYQHAGASICVKCQLDVAENLRAVIDMPEMSEAMYVRARRRDAEFRQDRRAESKRTATDPNSTGYVYYMRINGQIKIGYTANLRQRSSHYPPGTELVAAEPGTLTLEKQRHNQFSRDLARGREWFRESDKLAAHIADLVDQHGVPTELMHQHRKHEGAKSHD